MEEFFGGGWGVDAARDQYLRDGGRTAELRGEESRGFGVGSLLMPERLRLCSAGLALVGHRDGDQSSSSSTTMPPRSVTVSISSWKRSYHSVEVSNRNITP